MPYIGTLQRGTTITINVTSQANDRVAVSILKISKSERIAEAEPNSVLTSGQLTTFSTTIGNNIDRLVVLIAPPIGGQANVRVDPFAGVNVDADTQLTFDCI